MSDTGSQAQEGKTIQTHMMDQYSATKDAVRYCEKLFDDETNAYRFGNHEKEKITEAVKKTKEEIQKFASEQLKASDKSKQDKKRVNEDPTLKGLNKRLKRQEQALFINEGDMCFIEKRRWDAFTSLATLTKKRDQLLEEALKQREKEDTKTNDGFSDDE